MNKLLAKFFKSPDGDSLCELLKGRVGESNDLDYKEQWPVGPKLARHILGFANSGGGCMVVGVRECDDGSMSAVGIEKLRDKTKIYDAVKKFIPDDLEFDVHIIDQSNSSGSECEEINGKKFQVLRVADQPEHLPFVTLSDGDEIHSGQVYIRDGVSTRSASHRQLQGVLNRRIETEHSTERELTLKEHLDELKVLYAERRPLSLVTAALLLTIDRRESYVAFVDRMIDSKQRTIERLLQR